jgi:hypothetical protein
LFQLFDQKLYVPHFLKSPDDHYRISFSLYGINSWRVKGG